MNPNLEELKSCIDLMARSMGFSSLPQDRVSRLIDHILFENEYDGVEGKEGWHSFTSGYITEREIRNLVMAHSATKIARYEKKSEPNFLEYSTKELCQQFEVALLGRTVVPTDIDVLDPWERDNA